MSIWGEQWVCRCTWHNVFVRGYCRNCGEPRPASVEYESAGEVIERIAVRNDDLSRAMGTEE